MQQLCLLFTSSRCTFPPRYTREGVVSSRHEGPQGYGNTPITTIVKNFSKIEGEGAKREKVGGVS